MNNHFSQNLKKIRKDYNLSQEQLALELGVSRQAISKWESAIAYPEMDKIIALCNKFNLNIDDLLNQDIKEVKREEESKKKLNKTIDDFLKFIANTVNLFSNMNFKSKIKCLLEQMVIIGILIIISGGIILIGDAIFSSVLRFLPDQIYYFIQGVLSSTTILFCLITSIIILTYIFKTRYLDYYEKINDKISKQNYKDSNDESKENISKIIIRDPKHSEYKFINGLFKIIVLMIKFFFLCLALFVCFILICLLGLIVASFLVYKTGLFFIGLIITLLSMIVISVIILLLLLNFVFNRQNDKKKMIWTFIVSILVLGIGCGLIFVGTLNFEVLNSNETMLETKNLELEMTDNTFFYGYDNVKYVETNISNIKIQYKINKYCNLTSYSQDDKYGIHIWASCSNPTKLARVFIKNINDKKIVSINNEIQEIVVYASKKNIDKIKSNEQKYFETEKTYDETINEYEKTINELENKIAEYENKIADQNSQIEEYKYMLKNN